MVNGTAVWDGGAVRTRRFTQAQTTPLDQRLSPGSGAEGETKEGMREPGPEKGDGARPDTDKGQPMADLREETKREAALEMSEGQPAAKEEEGETGDGLQQQKAEALELEGGEITIHPEMFHRKQSTEDGSVFPTEDISPEQALGAQLQCLQTQDSTQETTSSVQEQIQIQSLGESVIPAVTSIQETTCPVQEQTQIPRLEESVTPAEATAEVTECWDEYVGPTADERHGGESSSKLIFSSLLTQTNLNLSGHHDTKAGWHFPAGPGLAEEVQCPLWQFPALSYYPPVEPSVPFEGENHFFPLCCKGICLNLQVL